MITQSGRCILKKQMHTSNGLNFSYSFDGSIKGKISIIATKRYTGEKNYIVEGIEQMFETVFSSTTVRRWFKNS